MMSISMRALQPKISLDERNPAASQLLTPVIHTLHLSVSLNIKSGGPLIPIWTFGYEPLLPPLTHHRYWFPNTHRAWMLAFEWLNFLRADHSYWFQLYMLSIQLHSWSGTLTCMVSRCMKIGNSNTIFATNSLPIKTLKLLVDITSMIHIYLDSTFFVAFKLAVANREIRSSISINQQDCDIFVVIFFIS